MDNENLLVQQAWAIRQQYEPVMCFSVPGAKHYDNRYYTNHASSFVNISVTGGACACRCDHCNGHLLETMEGALTPLALRHLIDKLLEKDTAGILVSGGANSDGEVPLLPYIEVMKYAKTMGLKVLVHGGLVKPETAFGLKEAGVDQVLIDVIGDEKSITQVYHLKRRPVDYLKSMQYCCEAGLNLAPHVVIGLHYGQIVGEIRALEMIREIEPETVVLVILTPSRGTVMAEIQPPQIGEVAQVIANARMLHPYTPLTLGCARPAGQYKRQVEIAAVECGVNGIAYPDESTIRYALSQGFEVQFTEECCSLITRKAACIMNRN
ncbi:MAG TPA: radical SAM protein [Syntrophomonadaceae bacterium]|nr:radical SAM protein [Syntrophomonadaceae bacterium]